jgi:hypothetical protein
MFQHGDRIRWTTTGDDGLPLVRYGFVGGAAGDRGPVVVMLDGELGVDVVELEQLQPVAITTVELHLDGGDLIEDPELRRGLVHLWQAEAESAGLDVDGVHEWGEGHVDDAGRWSLAEVTTGGQRYVVLAMRSATDEGVICLRAERPGSAHRHLA